MYYALRAAAKGGALNDGHQSTIAHLTGDKLRAHRFAFPPFDEQGALVVFLDQSLETLDRAVVVALTEITLLREYLTRLTADAVTGKLDVREAAARLPAQEPETLIEPEVMSNAEEEGIDDDLDTVSEEVEA
jgi:type I restriction enzyme S subunit